MPKLYDWIYQWYIIYMHTHHLESCTPGQDWAKWYVLVCTSTYQYNTVHVSTRIPNLYIPVCTSTYRYVLLRSQVVFWPTQKESGEMRLYIAYAWDTMWRGRISKLHKFSQVQAHTGTYWYILVRTGIYFQNTANFISSRSILPPAPTSLSRTLGLVLSHSFLPHCRLLHSQTTQAWLSTTKVPQPSVDLIHVAATPAISSCRVCTAHGKSWTLVLAELVWDCTHHKPSETE